MNKKKEEEEDERVKYVLVRTLEGCFGTGAGCFCFLELLDPISYWKYLIFDMFE